MLKPGDLVRVYREKSKRWVGPVEVTEVERKIVHVHDGVKTRQFNVVKVMPVQIGYTSTDKHLDRFYEFNDAAENEEVEKAKEHADIYLTETLKPGDPRTHSDKAKAAVKKELDGLFAQGVFELIAEADIQVDAVVLRSSSTAFAHGLRH